MPSPELLALIRQLYPRRLPQQPLVTARLIVAAMHIAPVWGALTGRAWVPNGWGAGLITDPEPVPVYLWSDRPGQRTLPEWMWDHSRVRVRVCEGTMQ